MIRTGGTVRTSLDLKENFNEISEFCRTRNEPVFITEEGTDGLVMLSKEEYERLCGREELHRFLDEGIAAGKKGTGRPVEEVFAEMERRFGFGKI